MYFETKNLTNQIILLIILASFIFSPIQSQRRNLLTAVKNGSDKYELSDGSTFKWCEEYKAAISGTPPNGLYEEKDAPGAYMYCQFESQGWEIQKDYQIIFRRMDGSFSWEGTTWEQFKNFQGNDNDFWTGIEYVHQKCPSNESCEFVLMLTTKDGSLNRSVVIENFYIGDEASSYRSHWENSCGSQIYSKSLTLHSDTPLSTYGVDNDVLGDQSGDILETCYLKYKSPWYFKTCHFMNPFGPYNVSGADGFSFKGANGTPDADNDSYQNLTYMSFGIRKYKKDEGDYKLCVLRKYFEDTQWLQCDVTKCATCELGPENCIIPCNEHCSATGCTGTGICTACENEFYYLENGQCKACIAPCKTCPSSTSCVTCLDGFLIGNTECKTCQDWKDDNCLNCTDFQNCNSCKPTYYVDSGSGSCTKCDSPCKNCSSSAVCTSCLTGYFYFGNECKTCQEWKGSNCLSCDDYQSCNQCEDGYFLDGNNCVQCDHQCSKCETSSDNCLECSDLENRLQDNNKCDCKPGFFNEGINQTCETCQSPCNECESAAVCSSCLPGFTQSGNECKTCQDWIGVNCVGCDDHLTCNKCEDGYFLDGNDCIKCDHQCSKCETSSDNCLLCSDLENRIQDNNKCDCKPGFFNEGTSEKCEACQYPCSSCSDLNTCTSCPDNNQIAPNCLCKDGYYNSGDNLGCKICSDKCVTCENLTGKCLTCIPGLNRNLNAPNCDCLSGYYQIMGSQHCQSCSSNCSECNNEGTCTKCTNTLFLAPFCNSRVEPNMMIDIQGKITINECHAQCSSCIEKLDNCKKCVKGLNRSKIAPACSCMEGYHDENNTQKDCIKCPTTCEKCQSQNTCTSCNSSQNRILNSYMGACECMQGYVQMENELRCFKCYAYLGDCVLECPQNTERDDKNYICSERVYDEKSQIFMLFICSAFLMILYGFLGIQINFLVKILVAPLKNIQDLKKGSEQLTQKLNYDNKNKNNSKQKKNSDDSNEQQSNQDLIYKEDDTHQVIDIS